MGFKDRCCSCFRGIVYSRVKTSDYYVAHVDEVTQTDITPAPKPVQIKRHKLLKKVRKFYIRSSYL